MFSYEKDANTTTQDDGMLSCLNVVSYCLLLLCPRDNRLFAYARGGFGVS